MTCPDHAEPEPNMCGACYLLACEPVRVPVFSEQRLEAKRQARAAYREREIATLREQIADGEARLVRAKPSLRTAIETGLTNRRARLAALLQETP